MGLIEDALRAYAKFDDRTDDPSTPSAGSGLIFFKDGRLHQIDDSGTVTDLTDGGPGGGGSPESSGATVKRTSNIGIPSSTETAVPWQATDDDTDGYWSSGNATRLTIPSGKGGVFLFGGSVRIAAHQESLVQVYWRMNGTDRVSPEGVDHTVAGYAPSPTAVGRFRLAAGDYVELIVWQNTGSTRDATTASGAWIERLGD